MADAFGNTIDEVTYDDSLPWPDADGNGAYLQLISTSLDNNLASSWVANTSGTLASANFISTQSVQLSPNPVNAMLHIQAQVAVQKVVVYSSVGQVLVAQEPHSSAIDLDVSSLANGIYFVQTTSDQGSTILKFIKQ